MTEEIEEILDKINSINEKAKREIENLTENYTTTSKKRLHKAYNYMWQITEVIDREKELNKIRGGTKDC